MKKKVFGLSLIIILMIIITGYGITRITSKPKYVEDDEILTTKAIDSDKTMITMRVEYGAGQQEDLESLIEEKFPDVDLVMIHDGSDDAAYTLKSNLEAGVECDLIFSRYLQYVGDSSSEYLYDLSGEDFVNSYYTGSIDSCADSEGRVYYLPGPNDIYGIVYDKTMFEEYGWEVPQSYSEFVSLINKIKNTNFGYQVEVEPFAVSLMYPDMFQIIFNTFGYDAVFAGADNSAWLSSYQNGDESMLGHMEPAVAAFETLFWDGVISLDALELTPGERSKMLYANHTTAMIVECQNAISYEKQILESSMEEEEAKEEEQSNTVAGRGKSSNSNRTVTGSTKKTTSIIDHDIAMMPFWTSDEKDSDYLYEIPSYYMAINKASTEESEEKKELLLEIMDYLSSVEGQNALIGDDFQLSSVEGVDMNENEFSEGVISTIKKGNLINNFYYANGEDDKQVERSLLSGVSDLLQGKIGVSAWLMAADTARDEFLVKTLDDEIEILGQSEENMTRLESAYTVADMYREMTGADIGIVLAGGWNYSTNGYIYKGNITEESLAAIKPDKELTTEGVEFTDDKIVTATLTGQQILDILEGGTNDTGTLGLYPYYVASGLEVRFNPWAKSGERVEDCELSDSGKFDTESTYKVAFYNGSLPEEIECEPELVLNMTWTEAFTRWLSDKGGVLSKSDMDIKLTYN